MVIAFLWSFLSGHSSHKTPNMQSNHILLLIKRGFTFISLLVSFFKPNMGWSWTKLTTTQH